MTTLKHILFASKPTKNGKKIVAIITLIGLLGPFNGGLLYPLNLQPVYAADLTCGNNVLEPTTGEQCDDGNTADGDGCSTLCQLENGGPVCGNNVLEAGEQCDDGNIVNTDGCTDQCLIQLLFPGICGNNILETANQESCDDGNTVSGDGCSATCDLEATINLCGNNSIDSGEQCDDGNHTSNDGCSPSCQLENTCGNGIVELGEQCDDGNANNLDGCLDTCHIQPLFPGICGNNILETANQESCDDGNTVSGDGCSATCDLEFQFNVCGNNVVEIANGEQCDDGNHVSGDGCSSACIIEGGGNNPVCGNNALETGEQCDDGNTTDNDGCSAVCQIETNNSICGNNILEIGEQCDDGNNASGDGCNEFCIVEGGVGPICGNNILETPEQCDDGNNADGDGCSSLCIVEGGVGPICGNNILETPEQCDDGNNASGDGCSASCSIENGGPVCGNNILESGEQCDDGNANSWDGCSATCQLEGNSSCNDIPPSITGWYGQYYNYSKNHPDMNLSPLQWPDKTHGDPLSVDGVWNTDWYDNSYFKFARIDTAITFGNNFFPFDIAPQEIDSGHEFHFGVHWRGLATVNQPDAVTYTLTSDDDAWVYLDGDLVIDNSGIHGATTKTGTINLTGSHIIDIFFAERHVSQSNFWFSATAPSGMTITPYAPDCPLLPACGNNILELGEQCDDGNITDGDGCSAMCVIEGSGPACGNNILESGEQCDDGNNASGDGCSSSCTTEGGSGPVCGNNILESGEQCDDGNNASGDGCSATCTTESAGPACGNNIIEIGEQCDDGNIADGDGCSAMCLIENAGPICGNNILEIGEQCDDGNTSGGDGCSSSCTIEGGGGGPICGNNILEAPEQCDDGNNASGDGCSATCTTENAGPACGNNILESGEQCDDGNTSGGDGCSSSCTTEGGGGGPFCGDGNINVGEQCDDGNNRGGDGCSSSCTNEGGGGGGGPSSFCGDGKINLQTGEVCDDGNLFSGDGCSATCQLEGAGEPILSIDKTVSVEFANPNEVVTYTIKITNIGTYKAINVILTDVLPNGFLILDNNAPSNSWELGDIAPNETKTIVYDALVGAEVTNGTYENLAIADAENYPLISDKVPLDVRGTILGTEFEELPDTDGPSITDLQQPQHQPFVWFMALSLATPGLLLDSGLQLDIDSLQKISESYKEAEQILETQIEQAKVVEQTKAIVLPQNLSNHLVIEKIGVDIPIYEGANSAQALWQGAWRIPISSSPDRGGNTVIAAHRYLRKPPSTKTFYNLDKVAVGDVIVMYWNDKKIQYRVETIKEVTPDQVEILENTQEDQLTLFTCTPLYSSDRRLVVIAKPIAE